MTKDQLLSLWNADNWEVMSCGVYFTAHRADADKELHINCYDTGDSPAGELYLNVSFDEQFVPSPKVGYDTF